MLPDETMGFYFGRSRIPAGALDGMFTAQEYCRTLGTVERQFVDCQPAFYYFNTADFSSAVGLWDTLLRQQPENRHIHRLVGLAYLSQRRLRGAKRHLELARRLLKREGTVSGSLEHALQVHLESAFLHYTLPSLYFSLGCPQDAHALVNEEGPHL